MFDIQGTGCAHLRRHVKLWNRLRFLISHLAVNCTSGKITDLNVENMSKQDFFSTCLAFWKHVHGGISMRVFVCMDICKLYCLQNNKIVMDLILFLSSNHHEFIWAENTLSPLQCIQMTIYLHFSIILSIMHMSLPSLDSLHKCHIWSGVSQCHYSPQATAEPQQSLSEEGDKDERGEEWKWVVCYLVHETSGSKASFWRVGETLWTLLYVFLCKP